MPNTREKLIELLMDKPYGRGTEKEETEHIEDVADYLIDNGVTVQKWIPVTERLPEQYKKVLVCDVRDDFVGSCSLYGDVWVESEHTYKFEEMTHWMPLPEPPKGE